MIDIRKPEPVVLAKRIILFFTPLFLTGSFMYSCDSQEVNLEKVEVVAYPNPFVHRVNLHLTLSAESEIKIYLYDQSNSEIEITEFNEGRLITKNPIVEEQLSEGTKNYGFDFSEMETGVYFLDVVINDKAKRIVLFNEDIK